MDASFNPHKQYISFFNADGTTVSVGMHELDMIAQTNVKVVTVFASQLGGCFVLLVLLAILTTPDRRRAPLFIVNLLSLALVVIRSVLQILYFLGPWAETYNYVAYYYQDIPMKDKLISIWAVAIQLVLHTCIMGSLILQVSIVYAAVQRVRTIMVLVSSAIAAISTGFFFTVVVQNSKAILDGKGYNTWVYKASRGIYAGAIFFFALIFVIKLGLAIHQRRILKLQKFGPLQIIFIMGCQTMIIPGMHPLYPVSTSLKY
jgi:pheromone alpha factor receptor